MGRSPPESNPGLWQIVFLIRIRSVIMGRYKATTPSVSMDDLATLPIAATIQQFAPIVNLSEKGLTDLCREGKVPAFKAGGAWRIHRDRALKQFGFTCEA